MGEGQCGLLPECRDPTYGFPKIEGTYSVVPQLHRNNVHFTGQCLKFRPRFLYAD